MWRVTLLPALALGLMLSGSASAQMWSRSTTINPGSEANAYNPNTYQQQKAAAEQRQKMVENQSGMPQQAAPSGQGGQGGTTSSD